jgi:hypothetical protein
MPITLQRVRSSFGAVEARRTGRDNTDLSDPPFSPMVLLPGGIDKTIDLISFGVHTEAGITVVPDVGFTPINAVRDYLLVGRLVVVKATLPTNVVYDPFVLPSEYNPNYYSLGDFRQGDVIFEQTYSFRDAGASVIEFPNGGLRLGQEAATILVTPCYNFNVTSLAYPSSATGGWIIAQLFLSVAGHYADTSPFSKGIWR